MNKRRQHRIIKGVMGLGIVLVATHAMAGHWCGNYDFARLDIKNNTSHPLYVDMGTPQIGENTGSGYVEAGDYHSFTVCSSESSDPDYHSGYKGHIYLYDYLYDRHGGTKTLLADWDVNEPFWKPTSISYHHHSDECKIAVWRYGDLSTDTGWSAWQPMGEHNTAGSSEANTQIYVQCGK